MMKPLFVKFGVSDDCTFSYDVIAPVYASSVEELYTYLSDNVRELGKELKIAQEHHRNASVAYHALARTNDVKACQEALKSLSAMASNVHRIKNTSLLTSHDGDPIEFEALAVETPDGYELHSDIQILTLEELFGNAVHVQVAPTQEKPSPNTDFNPMP